MALPTHAACQGVVLAGAPSIRAVAEEISSVSPKPSRRASEALCATRADFSIKPGVALVQLSQNESAMGLPSAWMEAAHRALTAASAYPDPECRTLRQAIAESLHLNADRVFCSAGLMECLQTLALAYLDPGDHVVIPTHAFFFFRQVACLAGSEVTLVPERDLHVDVDAVAQAVGGSTKMLIFANPGNPTGTYLRREQIIRLRSLLPASTLLVIDEAYAEFVSDDRYHPLFDLTDAGNVVVLRSFSKMYGLAGLRVGWAYAARPVIENLKRVQVPAIVSSIAESVASAAIRDQAVVHAFKREMVGIKRRFVSSLAKLSRIVPVESETNFVLLQTSSMEEAQDLDSFLRERGIVLRRQLPVGLGHCLRATIGTEEQMQFVTFALAEWSENRKGSTADLPLRSGPSVS